MVIHLDISSYSIMVFFYLQTCYIQLFSVYSYHVISWLFAYTCCYYHIVSYLFSIICKYCLYARTLSLFTHTLIRSLLLILNLHVQILDAILILFRWSMRPYALQGVLCFFLPNSSFLISLAFFYSCDYYLIHLYQTWLLFHFLFHLISCMDICICYCSDHALL